ncbi:hypothetical protein CAC42_6604 [Sphaceloma murrayae]|uniref:Zf-CHY-domain-containing protein n=1 Tax=Sphaceloma murrayae TaxID=2082308 RepID=A0A2K1QGQ0_9PEZI|nr:hypothetical protein CAC42_6604 [Sphaceloma murrayae]
MSAPEIRASTPSGMLPEDDGMRDLREKMHEIRLLALSTEETAKRMHGLMTQDYQTRNKASTATTRSAMATKQERPPTTVNVHLTDEDKEPSYHPDTGVQDELDELLNQEQSEPILGCKHYKRNVKVQCYDCQMWFPCRHCHDASPDLPWQHHLNRRKTQNMLCMLCKTPQPASEVCTSCGVEAAYYYCSKCKLWDNDSTKRIYHCDDCGICRRGEGLGKDFVHCKRCNVCISISTSNSHPCIERATDCDCPLCLEYLFSSSTPVVSLLCGHYMHSACYKELMNVTYRCPVCNKSAVNMELQWRKLDDEIRVQPMPEEDFEDEEPEEERSSTPEPPDTTDSRLSAGLSNLSLFNRPSSQQRRRVPRKVWVGCNDCGGRGYTPFHWLGLKCPRCDGYNTNQLTPTGSSDIRFIPTATMPNTSLQRHHDFTGATVLRSFDDPDLPTETTQPRSDRSAALLAQSPTRSALNPSTPSRSYFLSSSPSSAPSPRSWASSLSPTRLTNLRSTSASATSDEGATTLPEPDYLTLAMARLDRFGVSPSEFLARVGISPSEFLARLNISPPDFLERFGVSPFDFLQKVGRSLSPMRHYLESLDRDARERVGKAGERVGEVVAGMTAGGRWSRRDVAEGMERWERYWEEGKRRRGSGQGEREEEMGFWGGDGGWISGGEREDGDGEEDGEEEEEEEEEESESESGEEGEGDDGEEIMGGEGETEDDFELFGHR